MTKLINTIAQGKEEFFNHPAQKHIANVLTIDYVRNGKQDWEGETTKDALNTYTVALLTAVVDMVEGMERPKITEEAFKALSLPEKYKAGGDISYNKAIADIKTHLLHVIEKDV